jgi:hypothetical protein
VCSRGLFERLIVPQSVKKFPAFYRTKKFITVLCSSDMLGTDYPVACHHIQEHSVVAKPAIGRGPESVISMSHPHNIFF